MKQRNKNISCTNYEIENTAAHVVRYQRKVSHTGQRNKDCATTASAHEHEVRARERNFNINLAQNMRARETNFNARRELVQNSCAKKNTQTSALDEECQAHLLPDTTAGETGTIVQGR